MERQHARSDKGRSRMIRAFATALVLFTTAGAVPPHPSLLDRVRNGQTDLPYFATRLQEMHEKGICSGKHLFEDKDGRVQASAMTTAAASGPFRVLAILVQFSDHPGATAASFFDSLMFDSAGRTVADYYSEISYGQIDIVTVNLPSSLGWRTAPQTYAWYVNGQNGTGSYPQNSQKLTEDLVDQVDPIVNFANYDNDANGYVDVLVIVHSGTGAEYSGSSNDIWSHKWGITPRLKDGVYISDYTVQPEFWSAPGDMTIGVYSHELGHGFGLPDLYDVDYSSNGVGRWCIMSFGSWLGPTGFGESPAHPCAWSRTQMG
ncbi:MAG TPA: M6 family metalloprotease domain-containing protein, partial [Candidatus Deferrimicrobium sp.]|nr:M6 family metalloprotease domain-containing protein [Candidatus Deferrimicrobium sp.]